MGVWSLLTSHPWALVTSPCLLSWQCLFMLDPYKNEKSLEEILDPSFPAVGCNHQAGSLWGAASLALTCSSTSVPRSFS